jgi:hypothetical protein
MLLHCYKPQPPDYKTYNQNHSSVGYPIRMRVCGLLNDEPKELDQTPASNIANSVRDRDISIQWVSILDQYGRSHDAKVCGACKVFCWQKFRGGN